MKSSKKYLLFLIGLLLVVYFVNWFTPLRLTNDTVRYIKISDSLESAANIPSAATDFLPHGYPYFLLLLSKLHIARSFFICLAQLVYFLGTWWFIRKMFSGSVNVSLLIILGLLNWSSMKFVITPLSEMQFMFFSTGFLYFLNKLRVKRGVVNIILAVLFASLAIFTRTIGIVLLITGALVFIIENRRSLIQLSSRKWIWVPAILVVCGLLYATYTQLGVARYLDYHARFFRPIIQHPIHYIASITDQHAIDLAALLLNIPAPKLISSWGWLQALRDDFYLVIGLLALAWAIYKLTRRKGSAIPLTARLYVLLYILFILCWPLSEPRLWVPILPFVFILLLQTRIMPGAPLPSLSRVIRSIYICVGVAALAYYTHTSFNNQALAADQDAGIWHTEYENYLFNRAPGETNNIPRKDILDILKKYD